MIAQCPVILSISLTNENQCGSHIEHDYVRICLPQYRYWEKDQDRANNRGVLLLDSDKIIVCYHKFEPKHSHIDIQQCLPQLLVFIPSLLQSSTSYHFQVEEMQDFSARLAFSCSSTLSVSTERVKRQHANL